MNDFKKQGARRAMRLVFNICAVFGLWISTIAADAAITADALASEPRPWQLGFQEAVTPVMRLTTDFHNLLLAIIFIIALFVFSLLVYCVVRFRAKVNPVPSTTTHSTVIEILWTVIPIIILMIIAIPSIKLLYLQRDIPKADFTIKATGNQWYWTYEYPDHGGFSFDSLMVEDKDLKPGQPRLLAVDNNIVVPIGKTVRVIVTASDVIHDWAVPAFGIKMDGVPGRLNETWFKAEKTGIYYGQCSELCGVRHAFMPIAVKVVSEQEFKAWLAKAKKEFAVNREPVRMITARLAIAAQ
jgi:cytochrome c oxidase subunit II